MKKPRDLLQGASTLVAEVGEISLLVAVGYDDRAVAFSVLESNDYLSDDLAKHDVKLALWPVEFPRVPGLYLFTGRTTVESLGGSQREVCHRGDFTSLREGLAPNPQPAVYNA